MSINSSVQQVSGGIGSAVAGLIVIQQGSNPVVNYDVLGYVVIAAILITMVMMYFVNRNVNRQSGGEAMPEEQQLKAEI
jgi:predicted MFS family arabinose efflux permease